MALSKEREDRYKRAINKEVSTENAWQRQVQKNRSTITPQQKSAVKTNEKTLFQLAREDAISRKQAPQKAPTTYSDYGDLQKKLADIRAQAARVKKLSGRESNTQESPSSNGLEYSIERAGSALLGAGEALTDTVGAGIYGTIAGITSLGGSAPNKVSEWAYNNGKKFLDNSVTRDWEQSIEERYNPTDRDRMITGVGQTVVNMLPAVGAAKVAGATSKGIQAANAIRRGEHLGQAVFGLQAAGSSASKANAEGANLGQSLTYGATSGLAEALIERVSGGIPGLGKGVVSEAVSKVASNPIVRQAVDIIGEGGEEAVSTMLDPFLRRAIYDKNAQNATGEEIAQSAIMGALASGVLKAGIELPGAVSNAVSTRNQIASHKAQNNADITQLQEQKKPQTLLEFATQHGKSAQEVAAQDGEAKRETPMQIATTEKVDPYAEFVERKTRSIAELEKSIETEQAIFRNLYAEFKSTDVETRRPDLLQEAAKQRKKIMDLEKQLESEQSELSFSKADREKKEAEMAGLEQVESILSGLTGRFVNDETISSLERIGVAEQETRSLRNAYTNAVKAQSTVDRLQRLLQSSTNLLESSSTQQKLDKANAKLDNTAQALIDAQNALYNRASVGKNSLATSQIVKKGDGTTSTASRRATSVLSADVDPSSSLIIPQPQQKINVNPNAKIDAESSVGAATRNFVGTQERGFSKNLSTDQARNAEIQHDFQIDPQMYHALANKDTLAKASTIMDTGFDSAKNTLQQAIGAAKKGAKLSPEMVPLSKMVADQLAASGDVQGARDILSDIAVELTAAGQLGQAAKILRDAGPATSIQTMDKIIRTINEQGAKRYSKRWKDFSLTDAETKQFQQIEPGDEQGFQDAYKNVAKRIGSQMPSTLWERATEVRRVSMLLNPKTQVRNVVANLPLLLERKVSEKLSGGIQDILVKAGKLSPDQQTRTFKVSKQSKAIASDVYEQQKNVLNGVTEKWDAGGMNRMIQENRKYFGNTPPGKVMDALRNFTYKALELGDTPFLRSAFEDNLSRYVAAHGYQSVAEVPQAAIDFATEQAFMATFKDASVVSDMLNKLKRNGGAAGAAVDVLMPFTTTPVNLARRTVDYSPAAILQAASSMSKGEMAKAVDQTMRGLTGSAALGLAVLLAKYGLITGRQDDDRDKAAFDRANGNAPYSFMGKVSYEWAQPVATQLAAGVAIYDACKDKPDVLNALYQSLLAAGDTFADMTVFSNLTDLLQGYGSPTEKIVDTLTSGVMGQFTPSIFGAVARTADDTVRSSYTGESSLKDAFTSGVQAKIPFATKSLPASVNIRGEDNKRLENPFARAFQEFFNPANVNTGKSTAVDEEIQRVYDATGNMSVFPRIAQNSFESDGVKYHLDGFEKEALQRVLGETTYSVLPGLFQEDAYKNATQEERASMISEIISFAADEGKRLILKKKGVDYVSSKYEKAHKAEESGISGADYFAFRFALKGADGESSHDVANALMKVDISDAKRAKLWQMQNKTWSAEKNPFSGTLRKAGLPTNTTLAIMKKYSDINKKQYSESAARHKQTEFSQYLDGLNLSQEQRAVVDNTYQYYNMIPATEIPYSIETMSAAGQDHWAKAKDWGMPKDDYIKFYAVSTSQKKKADSIKALQEAGMTYDNAAHFYKIIH